MPWLPSMGSRFSLLIAAPLLLATPALAQQENGTEPVFNLPRTGQLPQTDTNRQGPELDVFRGAPVTVTPPPVVTPTIQVPPIVTPAPQPAPPPQQQRPAAATERAPSTTPQAEIPPPSVTPTPSETTPAPPATENQALPPAGNITAPAPDAVPPPPKEETTSHWPWIAAGAAIMLLIAAVLRLRRRKPEAVEEPVYEAEPVPPPPTPRPMQPKAEPAPPPPPVRPEPASTPTDRPWLDLAMEVHAARLTLMGATIGYALTLHNRGAQPAEDILVRSLIANADAQQQSMFQRFFAGETGLPVHSIVSIAPGETQKLTGEMRLDAQEIAAIQMGQRTLLIPLIAFDAHYRWTGASEGTGRTGRAFIVGEEQTPPVDRLSPFRLDLGPRQYRTPGSRATALFLAS